MTRRAERIVESKTSSPGNASLEFNFLLNQTCTAALLNLTLPVLKNLREKGEGPRWIRVGSGVRYRWSDLQAWLSREAPDK